MFDPETRNAYVNDAVIAILPEEVHEAVNRCEAFEALAVTLAKAAGDDPATMGKILDDVAAEIAEGRFEWVIENTDVPPAAFLQKRVREYVEQQQAEQELAR